LSFEYTVTLKVKVGVAAAADNPRTVKCDYSVMPENFCTKFGVLVEQGSDHKCAVFV